MCLSLRVVAEYVYRQRKPRQTVGVVYAPVGTSSVFRTCILESLRANSYCSLITPVEALRISVVARLIAFDRAVRAFDDPAIVRAVVWRFVGSIQLAVVALLVALLIAVSAVNTGADPVDTPAVFS